MQDKKQQLEPDNETDWFQIGKGVRHDCICHSTYLASIAEYLMQNAGPSLKGYAWKGQDFPINQDMSELQGTSGIIGFGSQTAG